MSPRFIDPHRGRRLSAARDRGLATMDREREADSYLATIGDACERCHVHAMIETWQEGREADWPSFAAQTLPMRQVARILRGEARHVGAGALEVIR